jgi:sulfatase maturation enzyme AslB (radical SAM superfamily)
MNHYLINTSWKCQLKCPYCLLPHIKINREAVEHSWGEWFVALRDHTPPGSIIDFAGGDPLLFEGLAYLLDWLAKSGRRWAITTNALSERGADELLRVRPAGGVQINISDHPGNRANAANVAKLRQVAPLIWNQVMHDDCGHNHDGEITTFIPYQSWREGTELDGIRRWCNSGTYHWVADPAGDVFRCNPAMATAEPSIGNLFKRTLVLPEPTICEHGCSTCYTDVPTAWPVEMRPL